MDVNIDSMKLTAWQNNLAACGRLLRKKPRGAVVVIAARMIAQEPLIELKKVFPD